MAPEQFLTITSASRSGSTLLEKLLCNHPQLSVLSQPFPYLFVDAKKSFYEKISHPERYYYLNHYFGETLYRPADVSDWLADYLISPEKLFSLMRSMESYSGQQANFPDWKTQLKDFSERTFLETLKYLLKSFAHRPDASYWGAKEIHIEEFLPFLIDDDFKAIIIIRDPRDVASSMNYGKGRDYTGDLRPLLFNLYNWRKSVAFALAIEDDPRFHWIRYEDLVNEPIKELNDIADFLDIEKFSEHWFSDGIRTQDGSIWKGNSSHGEVFAISSESIGRYREVLNEETISYIETVCGHEMDYFSYQRSVKIDPLAMATFREPFEVVRSEFSKDFSSATANIQREVHRNELFLDPSPSIEVVEELFIFEQVYEKLRITLKT